MSGRASVDKWQHYWNAYRPSVTLQAYHGYAAEKIAGRLSHLFPQSAERPGQCLFKLLDVGCGQGGLSIMLAEKASCETVALDIIMEPLVYCRNLAEKRRTAHVGIIRASVFQMPFRNGTFDVAVSTGSESAATYSGATEEVIRVVKKEGILFIDFTRMPNLYQPIRSLRSFLQYLRARRRIAMGEKTKYFHYGKLGLKDRFERGHGLKIRRMWCMNTSPPWGSRRLRLFFEKTVGRLLGPLLARTVLVEMENRKTGEI